VTRDDPDVSDVATPQRAAPRPETIVVAVVVVLVLVALLLRVTLDGDPDHRVAVDRGGRDQAVLTVASGADTITVRTDDVGGDLAVVTTPDGSRARPVADLAGDALTVTTTDDRDDRDDRDEDGLFDGPAEDDAGPRGDGPVDVVVRLSRDVRWEVVVAGGSQRLTLDLTGARAGRVEVRSGQGSIDATLPEPDGVLAMVVAGGAGAVAVHAPDGVPARLRLGAGAGSAALDDDRRQGLGAGTVLTSPTWSDGGDRIDVDATSGVGSLTLDRRAA
jgi:hypothetical protein